MALRSFFHSGLVAFEELIKHTYFLDLPLLLGTTSVCFLKLCDLLIIERDRRTPVPLFTDEVIPRRWLMTT